MVLLFGLIRRMERSEGREKKKKKETIEQKRKEEKIYKWDGKVERIR